MNKNFRSHGLNFQTTSPLKPLPICNHIYYLAPWGLAIESFFQSSLTAPNLLHWSMGRIWCIVEMVKAEDLTRFDDIDSLFSLYFRGRNMTIKLKISLVGTYERVGQLLTKPVR